MKKSYAKLMFMRKSGIWPSLCQLMAILAKLLDIDFKFWILGSNFFWRP